MLAGRDETAVGGIGGLGAFALLAAFVSRHPAFVAWSVAFLGAEYAVALMLRDEAIDPNAPFYACGLLLVAELGHWALERPVPGEPGLAARRAWVVAAMVVAAGGVGAVVLAMSELATGGGLLLQLLGVSAAVGVLALVVVYARRAAPLAALAVAALATVACGGDPGGRAVQAPGARPQSVTLRWSENCGTKTSPLLIRTNRIVVRPDGWTLHVSVTNRTGVPLGIVRPKVFGGALFGLAVYRTASKAEVAARARTGTAKPQLVADTFRPRLPPALLDGRVWTGSATGRGVVPRGFPVRVVIGRFVVHGDVPSGLVPEFLCVSDRVVRL